MTAAQSPPPNTIELVAGPRVAVYLARGLALHDATAKWLGSAIRGALPWFDERGWYRERHDALACGECNDVLHEFRHPYISGGRTYRHWALVCVTCSRAWGLDEFGRSEQRLIRRECENARRDKIDASPHHVYVIQLDEPSGPTWYVGQTGRAPAERFEQHLRGYKASRSVRRYGRRLVPDVYARFNPTTKNESEFLEAALADSLEAAGFVVRGGH